MLLLRVARFLPLVEMTRKIGRKTRKSRKDKEVVEVTSRDDPFTKKPPLSSGEAPFVEHVGE